MPEAASATVNPSKHDAEYEADYVIVGAGAVGMAFADSLLGESPADMVIVDRRHAPGGHWNDAYPFVRLHAPSENYGVNSRPLGSGTIDAVGLNRGFQERASAAEICAYYDHVMQQRLLHSGRVRYLPMSDYEEGGRVTSRLSGMRVRVHARRKLVDATFAETRLPSTHAPSFAVASGVRFMAPNDLPRLREAADGYVIIGAGKTAMDTAVWLLEMGVAPDSITWIRPRDAWMLNRAHVQPGFDFRARTLEAIVAQMEATRDADSVDGLFARLERTGEMLRIDTAVTPTMFRCAIVSEAELQQLRRIDRVIRLGHVQAIEPGCIRLAHGSIATSAAQVHIDCTADGITHRASEPIFQPGRIVLQYVRRCSPAFSAALVAHLEATLDNDAAKNAMSATVPVPDVPLDWLRMQVQEAGNQGRWARSPELRNWLADSRLDALSAMLARTRREGSPALAALLERLQQAREPALANMEHLLARAAGQDPSRQDALAAQAAQPSQAEQLVKAMKAAQPACRPGEWMAPGATVSSDARESPACAD